MSRRPPPASAAPQGGRQNEYFVPRDGIDREVITADICRYLGNDALVRPGNYESPQTGAIQGYFINAYRNLTSAMIEDLKADSARWEQERRAQSASRTNTAGGGGTTASRDSNIIYVRSSNSPAVQYRNSDTHQSRQVHGPSQHGSVDSSRSYGGDAAVRYPGSGAPGYTGASNAYAGQGYPTQSGYGLGYTSSQAQFAAAPTNPAPYVTGPAMTTTGYGQIGQEQPYTMVDANSRIRNQNYGEHYQAVDPRDARDARGVPVTTIPPANRTTYTTSGGPAVSPGYSAASSNSNYYSQNPPPAQTYNVQPTDAFYGRGAYKRGYRSTECR
ncbi:hypothetical protein GGR56DRAFT_469617 [Xylariaceae sp. FL0804]|nr:hypothetical protein GGR56DRAFT_469617 [Xylariaceae sp. FL0804]